MNTICSTPSRPSQVLGLSCPGKINLLLRVLGRRRDGFHEIRSLAIGVSLCDKVSVRAAPAGRHELTTDALSLQNRENLVLAASRALAAHLDGAVGARFELRKEIPIGGGMGGGSSDAAAALRLVNGLWNAGLSDAELARIGEGIGSDVPLFFHLPAAWVRGRGELAQSVSFAWRGWVVLVAAGEGVSTARVYQAWKPLDGQGRGADSSDPEETAGRMQRASAAAELEAFIQNDLEDAVFGVAPGVAEARERLASLGLGRFTVSGAGSVLFRLFDVVDEARLVAAQATAAGAEVRVMVAEAPVGMSPLISEETAYGDHRRTHEIEQSGR